jgi:hypothetical protein
MPDGIGDKFLAGAAFSLYEDRRIRGCDFLDKAEDLTQLPALADKLEGGLFPDEFLFKELIFYATC